MRLVVLGVLLMGSVASAQQDMAVPVSQAPKIVPMFSLMASVIAAPDPHLPDAFKSTHAGQTVKGTFEICFDTSGHVEVVKPVVSLGDSSVDGNVADQIKRTWLYKPQPMKVCFRKPLVFVIHGAAAPASMAQPKSVPPFVAQAALVSSPTPRLPDAFKNTHAFDTVKATYRICSGADAHVASVTKISSELDDATDAAVIDQIQKTWSFKPQTEAMCFLRSFLFKVN